MNKDKMYAKALLVLCALLLCVFVFGLIEDISLRMDSGRATARVLSWDLAEHRLFVTFSYTHPELGELTITKNGAGTYSFNGNTEFNIRYSKRFPYYTSFEGVPNFDYVIMLAGIAVVFWGAWWCIQVIRE